MAYSRWARFPLVAVSASRPVISTIGSAIGRSDSCPTAKAIWGIDLGTLCATRMGSHGLDLLALRFPPIAKRGFERRRRLPRDLSSRARRTAHRPAAFPA